jgi:hypothetical protein
MLVFDMWRQTSVQRRTRGAYVDVHTKKNPRDELRGQIVFED